MHRTFALVAAAAVTVSLWPHRALAVCRVVEPTTETGGIVFDSSTMILYVLAPDQVVAYRCPGEQPIGDPLDGGAPELDAGVAATMDGGLEGEVDAGMASRADAGTKVDDGGLADPEPRDGGPLATADAAVADAAVWDASSADAGPFGDAGFDATDAGGGPDVAGPPEPSVPVCEGGASPEPVRGTLVSVVVQPAMHARAGRGGLVMPVPALPYVGIADADYFSRLGALMTPRVVERYDVVEDSSLGYQCHDPAFGGGGWGGASSSSSSYGGCGASSGPTYGPDAGGFSGATRPPPTVTERLMGGTVRVADLLTTDTYVVRAVSASTLAALADWLDANAFGHSEVDDAAFAHYVKEGAWFVVVSVTSEDLGGETVGLLPLVVSFAADEISIPHHLQYDPDGGLLETEAFVAAPNRMDLAGEVAATTQYAAPTVFPMVEELGLGHGWLTHLRWSRSAAAEVEDGTLVPVGNIQQRPTLVRTTVERIPSSRCPGRSSSSTTRSSGGGGICSCRVGEAGHPDRLGAFLVAGLVAAVLARRRRRARRGPGDGPRG